MSNPTPNPDPLAGIAPMGAKTKVTAPKPTAPVNVGNNTSTVTTGAGADPLAGIAPMGSTSPAKTATTTTTAPAKKTFAETQQGILPVASTVLNSIQTPLYWIEDLAYRLATPTTQSERKRMDASIAKNGYLGWLGEEWATSAKNATAWTTGGEVKHTGGAIAKRLGWTINNQSDGSAAKSVVDATTALFDKNSNVTGVAGDAISKVARQTWNTVIGTAIDVALDPTTYIPAAPIFRGFELLGKTGAAAAKGVIRGAAGSVPEWAAKKLVTSEGAKVAAEKGLLTAEDLAKAKTTPLQQKGIIKPQNRRPVGEVSVGAEIQKRYLDKLANLNTNMVKLPNAVDRSLAEKAFDATLSAVDNGIRAAKDVIFSSRANYKLSEYAKAEKQVLKQAARLGTDYVYHGAQNATEDVLAPKPSEIAIKAPAGAKRSRVAMPESAPTAYETAMKSAGFQDIKAVKSILGKVDALAKKTTGTSASAGALSETVSRFIEGVNNKSNAIFKGLKPQAQTAIQDAIKLKDGFTPKELFNEYLAQAQKGAKENVAFLNAYGNKVYKFSTGSKTVGKYLAESGDTHFLKLPKADQMHLMNGLTEFTADSSKANLDKLSQLVPDEGARKALLDAGALNGAAADRTAVKKILSDLQASGVGGKPIAYNSAEELIAGIRAGDAVPAESLLKIMKALDPNNQTIVKFEKSATKPSAQMLTEMLKDPAGPALTLTQMRKRLTLADTKTFLSATGLSQNEVISAYLDARALGMTDVTPMIHGASREYAAGALAGWGAKTVQDATELLRETFGQRFDEALALTQKQGGHTRTSSLGDIATLGAEKPHTGEAVLADQTNQSFQSVLVAKLLGRNTWRIGKKMEKMDAELFASYNVAENKIDWFIQHMAQMRETLLATTGSRMFIQKEVKNLKFDAVANRHSVYIDMGDIVQVFAKTEEGKRIIENALFSPEKRDSLDFNSILNVTRQALEAREKGIAHDATTLAKTAAYKAKGEALSASYKANIATYAEDFVYHLLTVAGPDLEAIHLLRAQGAVEDWLVRSQDISGQMIGLLRDGWNAATKGGYNTNEEMFQQLKMLFDRFAYVSDAIRQSDGRVAEAVMRATSMLFVKNGKVTELGNDALSEVYHLVPQLGSKDHGDFVELLNSYARHEDPMLSAPVGRERLPKPSPEVVAEASKLYTKAKDAYIEHAKAGLKLDSKEALKEWRATAKKIQGDLAKARDNAYKAWLPIEHYSNQFRKFIPVEAYDHAAELKWAETHPPRLIGDSLERVTLTDTATIKRVGTAGNGGEKAAAKAAANAAVVKHNEDLANAYVEDAATGIGESWDVYDGLGLEPTDTAIRAMEDSMYQQIAAHQPKVYTYSPVTAKGEGLSIAERIAQKASGTAGDLAGFRQMAESQLHSVKGDLARSLNQINKNFQGLEGKDWSEAISLALSKSPVNEMADPEIQVFQAQVNEIISSLLRDAEKNNINLDALASRLKDYGLKESDGFKLTGRLEDLMRNLPFMEKPAGIPDGSSDAIDWAGRQKKFEESSLRPVDALIKIGSAVHHVKTTQGMAASLAANFSHKGYGMTFEQAAKAGWVKVKSTIPTEISSNLPDDVLFHPTIAKQVAAFDREWTALMKGQDYGRWTKQVHTMMRAISWWKFSQTTLNPRHHIGNFIGDTQAELLRGNLNPMHWKLAWDIANESARALLKTDYLSRLGKDAQPAIDRFLAHETNPEKLTTEFARYTKGGKTVVPVVINGKTIHMSIAELVAKMQQKNILTNSYYNDEVSALYENLVLDTTASGANRQLVKSATLRARMGVEGFLKPFGDFTAVYSNYPRAAGAIDIMSKRSWSSEEEMWAAVSKHTHLYHPSIQSLSSGERKYGRLFVGYYTWLRVAHGMLFDLLINHTAGVTIVPKIMNNIRQQQGIEQQNPGSPWGANAWVNTPMNMLTSPYGPLLNTAQYGQIGIKTYTAPLDVMENYQFFYDPGANGNISDLIGENAQAGQALVGGQLNPIFKQVGQEVIGTDFQTGKKYTDRSAAAMWDRFLQTLGPTQLAEGLGIYTPMDKANGYTQQTKDLKVLKYLTGGKQFVTQNPDLTRAAQKGNTARLNTFLKNLPKENK